MQTENADVHAHGKQETSNKATSEISAIKCYVRLTGELLISQRAPI